MENFRKYIWAVVLVLQIVVMQIMSAFPDFVERYYSNGIYPVISRTSRIIFGSIPISVGDIIYILVIVYLLARLIKTRKTIKGRWKEILLRIINVISIGYFIFNLLWGINYVRVPLDKKLGIDHEYTEKDLHDFTKLLIEKTNRLHLEITENDTLKVVFSHDKEVVMRMNHNGYRNLSKSHPEFHYSNHSVKKSLISLPLTYMGFAGYLNPFTNEAQVNSMLPDYSFAATSCHEMAHQIGYASESEANFIGYLAAINNDDLYIQYSGYTLALRYCLGNWEVRDEKTLAELEKSINPGILKNFVESRTFWEQYESFIEVGFHIFYDNFLKINQQEEGLESYSRFVDLLVNYHKKTAL